MSEAVAIPDFNDLIVRHARKDFPLLEIGMTVEGALDRIRREGLGERVIYFYVIDDAGRLAGVLPTRRILTSPLQTRLEEILVRRVVAVPASATVLEACEFFVLYKFFAFPVVDSERRVVGIIDVSLFTDEVLGIEEPDSKRTEIGAKEDDLFEALGFRLSQIRGASPLRVFRYRFPWLLATVCSGTLCAVLAALFHATLATSLVLAFFLTMVLGLNESVSMQSMTVTIQALRATPFTARWFLGALRREVMAAAMLGCGCGAVVSAIVWLWHHDLRAALAIGGSIACSLVTASLFGLAVPALLHRWKLDPKIAAGPVTLAFTDFFALGFYLTIGWLVLR